MTEPGTGGRTDPPAVSVICTARNAAATIEATLQSVLAQDRRDWELVVVDDGSTDTTAAAIDRFARRDGRIRLVKTPGVGRGRALNLAVGHARAELIANLDADDLSHPRRLSLQLEALRARPEFALLCTNFIVIRAGEPGPWPELDGLGAAPVKDVTDQLTLRNPVLHSSVLIRKAVLLDVGGYSEHRSSHFDYELWIRLAARGHRIGRVHLPLAAKRLHPGQAFGYGKRIAYLRASTRLQVRAIRLLGRDWRHLLIVPVRFGWGLMPSVVRGRFTRSSG